MDTSHPRSHVPDLVVLNTPQMICTSNDHVPLLKTLLTMQSALHQVALGLGHAEDAAYYLNRSRYWRNFYDQNATSLNYTGFIQPRAANGSFIPYDPLNPYGYWGDAFYEAS